MTITDRITGILPGLHYKLTRAFYLSIPEGMRIKSNIPQIPEFEVGPIGCRKQDWKKIPREARYRLCVVYAKMESSACSCESGDNEAETAPIQVRKFFRLVQHLCRKEQDNPHLGPLHFDLNNPEDLARLRSEAAGIDFSDLESTPIESKPPSEHP